MKTSILFFLSFSLIIILPEYGNAQNQIGIEVQPTFSYSVNDVFSQSGTPDSKESTKAIYVVPVIYCKLKRNDSTVLYFKAGYFRQNWSDNSFSTDGFNTYIQDELEKHDNVFLTVAYGKSFMLGPVGIDFGLQCPFTFHLNENFSYKLTEELPSSKTENIQSGTLKNSVEAGLGSYLTFTTNLWGNFYGGFSLSYNYSFWKRKINFKETYNYYDMNGVLSSSYSYTDKRTISTFQSSDFFPSILLSYSIGKIRATEKPEVTTAH